MKHLFLLGLLIYCTHTHAQTFVGESVAYDSVANRFFTSSNGTSILQRTAGGQVSYFGVGLNASYGMEVMDGKLFAIDGDHVFAYELATATTVSDANITGASFLNGLASNGINTCWATDFGSNKIYKIDFSNLSTPAITTIVNNTGCTPNGIVFDEGNNRLVYTCWGANAAIRQVDLATNATSILVTTALSNIDGIDHDGNGNFYISSWSPDRITRFTNNFTSPAFTVPASSLNNPADICYAKAIDTLAIPNSTMVTFIGFGPTATNMDTPPSFECWSENGKVYLNTDRALELTITTIDGATCYHSKFNGNGGQNHIIHQGIQPFTEGIYIVSIFMEQKIFQQKLYIGKY
ncbi:MAG: hypothetical protein RIQ89_1193 [Bacteroidota bacterium]|jgi:hypothetical protein